MSEINKTEAANLTKRAFEVSHMLLRLCIYGKNGDFRRAVEPEIWNFLRAVSQEDYEIAQVKATTVRYFLLLAADIGFIHAGDAEYAISEIGKVNSAIEKAKNSAKLPNYQFDSKLLGKISEINRQREKKQIGQKLQETISAIDQNSKEEDISSQGDMRQQIRQSAILSKIRQIGNCRLPSLVEFFPDISERTMRYYIERLIDQGSIERVGSRGPGTFYVAKDGIPSVLSEAQSTGGDSESLYIRGSG